ncbi:MAG: cytochrome c maturation protein CcmE [Alphaproteobacteria bacterium CG11_big_fil_rev_8_21_14_0_20_44_7]|nr:MAG: cytochrome c maturation protein CcmE [Alphaproteobacteria bacterium CG11_big_fil_rev_8_21_14_0_20_44_7]
MPPRRQRLYFIIFSMILVAVALSIILYAFDEHIEYFKTPTDLKIANYEGKKIRLGGLVKEGSFHKVSEDCICYSFIVTDLESDVEVQYNKTLPGLFREGQGVIATGKISASGVFEASQVLAKHDENYMPPEVYEALKANGYKK